MNDPRNTWKYSVQWAAFLAEYEEGMRTWWGNYVDLQTGEIIEGTAPPVIGCALADGGGHPG